MGVKLCYFLKYFCVTYFSESIKTVSSVLTSFFIRISCYVVSITNGKFFSKLNSGRLIEFLNKMIIIFFCQVTEICF